MKITVCPTGIYFLHKLKDIFIFQVGCAIKAQLISQYENMIFNGNDALFYVNIMCIVFFFLLFFVFQQSVIIWK
jgi:hypothetical protein